MQHKSQLRLERWEKIKRNGMPRFVLKNGAMFALLFGCYVLFMNPEVLNAWQVVLPLIFVGGLIWGMAMWFVNMWLYCHAKGSR